MTSSSADVADPMCHEKGCHKGKRDEKSKAYRPPRIAQIGGSGGMR